MSRGVNVQMTTELSESEIQAKIAAFNASPDRRQDVGYGQTLTGRSEVTVYRDVTPTPEGMPWYTAAIRGHIEIAARYSVPQIDDYASWPHVCLVRELHPGCSVVYL